MKLHAPLAVFAVLGGVFASSFIAPPTASAAASSIPVPSPNTVGVDPNTNRAYVASAQDSSITVVDVPTETVIDTIPIQASAFDVAIDPGRGLGYVAGASALFVIDLATNAVIDQIPVQGPGASNVYRVEIDVDAQMVYAVGRSGVGTEGMVAAIDAQTRTVTGIVIIPNASSSTTVAVDTTTGTLYSASPMTKELLVIDGSTLTISDVIALPGAVDDIVVDSATQTVYSAAEGGNSVYVVDANAKTLTATLALSGTSGRMALDVDLHRLYRPGFTGATVVDTLTNRVTGSVGPSAVQAVAAVNPLTHDILTLDRNNGVLIIIAAAPPTITGTLGDLRLGEPVDFQYTVGGEPIGVVTVTGGALPDGVSIDGTGRLTGTPTAAGPFEFELTATNAFSTATHIDALTVTEIRGEAPTISGTAGELLRGEPVDFRYDVGGVPIGVVTVTDGTLPDGVSIDDAGHLTGTPTAPGTFRFDLTTTNTFGSAVLTDIITIADDASPTPAPDAKPVDAETERPDGLANTGSDAAWAFGAVAAALAALISGGTIMIIKRRRAAGNAEIASTDI